MEIPDSDLTLEQVEHFTRTIRRLDRHQLTHVRIGGGEPLLWGIEKVVQVVDHLKAIREVAHIDIQTNWTMPRAMEQIKRQRANPKIRWQGTPPERKDHQPWLISPKDLGVAGLGRCWVRKGCGWGFEAWGFTYCTVAGIMGRLLRINPYAEEPQLKVNPEICEHCIYSVPQRVGLLLRSLVYERKIDYPTPTLAKGLELYQKRPVIFDRVDP